MLLTSRIFHDRFMILIIRYLDFQGIEYLNNVIQIVENRRNYLVKLCINLLKDLSCNLSIIAITLKQLYCIFGDMKKPGQVRGKTGHIF